MTQREVCFDTLLASILACFTHKHALVLIQELSFGLLLFVLLKQSGWIHGFPRC